MCVADTTGGRKAQEMDSLVHHHPPFQPSRSTPSSKHQILLRCRPRAISSSRIIRDRQEGLCAMENTPTCLASPTIEGAQPRKGVFCALFIGEPHKKVAWDCDTHSHSSYPRHQNLHATNVSQGRCLPCLCLSRVRTGDEG
jgi:hypothetical protein